VTPTDVAAHFDRRYADDSDPWGASTRWYERRKRDLALAALGREHYGRVFEPGCGSGAMTAALAPRCDHLLALDVAARAVEATRARTASLPQVRVCRGTIPADWPTGSLDLVVLSEVAYYLEPEAVRRVAGLITAALAPGGELLAVHWRGRADDLRLSAAAAHEALASAGGLDLQVALVDPRFLLATWRRR
jgi:SAM-dependent methyltransferase